MKKIYKLFLLSIQIISMEKDVVYTVDYKKIIEPHISKKPLYHTNYIKEQIGLIPEIIKEIQSKLSLYPFDLNKIKNKEQDIRKKNIKISYKNDITTYNLITSFFLKDKEIPPKVFKSFQSIFLTNYLEKEKLAIDTLFNEDNRNKEDNEGILFMKYIYVFQHILNIPILSIIDNITPLDIKLILECYEKLQKDYEIIKNQINKNIPLIKISFKNKIKEIEEQKELTNEDENYLTIYKNEESKWLNFMNEKHFNNIQNIKNQINEKINILKIYNNKNFNVELFDDFKESIYKEIFDNVDKKKLSHKNSQELKNVLNNILVEFQINIFTNNNYEEFKTKFENKTFYKNNDYKYFLLQDINLCETINDIFYYFNNNRSDFIIFIENKFEKLNSEMQKTKNLLESQIDQLKKLNITLEKNLSKNINDYILFEKKQLPSKELHPKFNNKSIYEGF